MLLALKLLKELLFSFCCCLYCNCPQTITQRLKAVSQQSMHADTHTCFAVHPEFAAKQGQDSPAAMAPTRSSAMP